MTATTRGAESRRRTPTTDELRARLIERVSFPSSLFVTYAHALTKSPEAIHPHDAWGGALNIVGTAIGEPIEHPTMLLDPFPLWLDTDNNRAKVEAVALDLIAGRLVNKSSDAALNEIIRSADTRLRA